MPNITLDRFKRINQSVNPELLGDDEMTIFVDAVLDDETGRPVKRGGWAAFNTNRIDTSTTITSLDEVVTGQPKAIVKTVTSVVSGTGGVARFTHATGIAFPVGTTITNSTFGVGGYNVSQDVTVSATTYYELTVAYSSDSTGIGTPVTTGKNYLLAGINSKLRKSLDGTGVWSDVTSKGTPPYRMESYADGFIFTEGSVAPFIVSDNTLTDITDLEITPMDVSDMYTGHAAGGNLSLGMYKWVFCYVTDKGELSPPSIPVTHHYDANYLTTNAGAKTVGFGKAGGGSNYGIKASTDTRVTAIRVFRTLVMTEVGTGSEVYYYVTQLENKDQNWFDEMSDDDLGSKAFDFLNCPLTSEYLALHKERIWQGYISRTVKNWIRPAISQTDTFNATNGSVTAAFTAGVAFSISDGGAAATTLGAATYTYKIDFVDSEGLRSDTIISNSVAIDAGDKIIFNRLPFSNNENIVRADVYRKIGSAAYFKVWDYIPTWYNIVDSLLAIEDVGFADGTEYATNIETEATKTGIAFSEIGQPASYPLENLRNIYPDDGDEITGLYDDIDGLLIFKKNSICKIYTSGSPENWRLVKLLDNIGCNEPYSIAKYGNDYYFVHYNKTYKFNLNGYEDIGEPIKDTLSGWSFLSATASKRWYLLGIASGPSAKFLVYDMMLKTWYNFTTSGSTYIATIKEHGTNTGKIITANTQYLLYYSVASTDLDTDMSTPLDITPIIRSKTFKLGDGISLARLRKLKFNYKKLDGKSVVITIINPDSAVTNTYTDTTNATLSPDWKTYEPSLASDSLTVTPKFYINVTGAGLTEWGNIRLEFKPVNRGKASV